MLPELQNIPDSIVPIDKFGGLDKRLSIAEGTWSDMKNMTNDYYPVLANRAYRGYFAELVKPQGIAGGRAITYVDDDQLFFDGTKICNLKPLGVERKIIIMGAYIVVFPDGIIYNTYTAGDIEYIENETTATGVNISLCKLDGTKYSSTNTVVSTKEPSDKTKYWMDTSKETVVLKVYSESTSMWNSVGTTYVKFEAEGIGAGFKEYDAVTFSGVDTGSWVYNGYDFNQSNIVFAVDDDAIVVVGLINLNHVNSQAITFKRELPEMDFVCEYNNRIYGCSSDNHEIYACKLGDPKNWKSYAGLDSDSYAATVGTQNRFTGIAAYGGYVFFFKEDGYHKLYGSKPSSFQMMWVPGSGVQFGSDKSVVVVDGALFYKSNDNVIAFNGTNSLIGEQLGIEPYYEAVAGVFRHKYYVSMRNREYEYKLYVYDTKTGMWCIEDDIHALYMAYANTGLYIVTDDNKLIVVNPDALYKYIFPQDIDLEEEYFYPGTWTPGYISAGTNEGVFEWNFESGDIDMTIAYHKYVKRLIAKFWLNINAKIRIQVMYDNSGDWLNVGEYYATRKRSFEIPVVIQRCDQMRIRFSGFGDIRFYSLSKAFERGSET